MSARSSSYRFIVLLSVLSVLLANFMGFAPPLRPAITFWFMLTSPGLSLVRLFHLRELITELVLTLALSIAIDALLAEVLLYAGWYSAISGLLALSAISMTGCFLLLWQEIRALQRV